MVDRGGRRARVNFSRGLLLAIAWLSGFLFLAIPLGESRNEARWSERIARARNEAQRGGDWAVPARLEQEHDRERSFRGQAALTSFICLTVALAGLAASQREAP